MIGSRPAPSPPTTNPTPKPLQPSKDKGKGNEIVVEPLQRWTPVKRDQRRLHHASTSGDPFVPPPATTVDPTTMLSTRIES